MPTSLATLCLPLAESALLPAWPLALRLLAVAALGRVALAWLPAGRPGGHAPQALPATWATSHALGTLLLGAWSKDGANAHSLGWLAGIWSVCLVLRLASLPAAMLPRHAPRLASIHAGSRWLIVVGLLALGWAGRDKGLACVNWIALSLLLCHALRAARLPALAFAWLPLGAAAWLSYAPGAQAPLGLALGLSGMLPWLRIAERRGALLAALGFASLLLSAPFLAGAGLAALVARSRPAQRKYALTSSIAASALFLVTLLL